MDVARESFVRHVALEKWREVEDLRETLGLGPEPAAREAGRFPGRGAYGALWARRWNEQVPPQAAGGEPGRLFAAIEAAVATAVRDEEAARAARGDRPLDEDPEYKAFVDAALGRFLGEAAGGLEPMDR
ncbi:MAG TPA: hypothetical protein VIG69_12540 [Candidatus Methylomirabilis sp.]